MINVVTWFWGTKYAPFYVERLARGLRRHLKQPHRLLIMTDQMDRLPDFECHDIWDLELTSVKGCFARLRMFDPEWQDHLRMLGKRIVNIDLDAVITGPLDPLFDRPEPFVILQGANSANPCPFNGSLFMLQTGAYADVWRDFSLEAAKKIPFFEFPDDQGWLHFKVPKAAGWQTGSQSGIWSFKKRAWPATDQLPFGARLVVFPGARDPAQFRHLPWIKEHWEFARYDHPAIRHGN